MRRPFSCTYRDLTGVPVFDRRPPTAHNHYVRVSSVWSTDISVGMNNWIDRIGIDSDSYKAALFSEFYFATYEMAQVFIMRFEGQDSNHFNDICRAGYDR